MISTGSSITTRLAAMIADHETRTGKPPTTAVLPGRLYYELMREMAPWMRDLRGADGIFEFDGVRIERRRPSIFCAGCGAPAEPSVCSYCKRPTDLIEMA